MMKVNLISISIIDNYNTNKTILWRSDCEKKN